MAFDVQGSLAKGGGNLRRGPATAGPFMGSAAAGGTIGTFIGGPVGTVVGGLVGGLVGGVATLASMGKGGKK